MTELARVAIQWYERHARDLPWRAPGVGAWPILVSEVMLQQTPVARVLPVWQAWVARWPTPAALAAEPPAEAIGLGPTGVPRRALRLQCATVLVERHGGEVPLGTGLLALPGSAPTPRGRWRRSRSDSVSRWWTPTSDGWWPGVAGKPDAGPTTTADLAATAEIP